MPIRFRCEHCRQLLSVGSKKAGTTVSCPKCNTQLTVPAPEGPEDESGREESPGVVTVAIEPPTPAVESPLSAVAAAAESATSQSDDSIRFPELSVYEYETEFVYVEEEGDEREREAVDFDRVAVPRWILYAQGVLLAVAALLGFGFGVVMGSSAPQAGVPAQPSGPLVLAGDINYDAGDNLPTPDDGAAVLLVPEDARPEQKAPVAALLPGAGAVDASDPSVTALREIGGDFARADREGKFRLVAPQTGSYFLLFISAHRNRRAEERIAPQDLAELGRYVESAPDLLRQSRYEWRKRRLQENEEVTHVFR